MANDKPILIRVGRSFVDPTDVVEIRDCSSKRHRNLWIVRLRSQPNPEFPLWCNEEELEALLEHFRIKE